MSFVNNYERLPRLNARVHGVMREMNALAFVRENSVSVCYSATQVGLCQIAKAGARAPSLPSGYATAGVLLKVTGPVVIREVAVSSCRIAASWKRRS